MPEHRLTRGQVRDPVHRYVSTTTIERAILDDRLAQRLRGVGQSAAAHLVFPSMTVTRFAHSLGAMHIASRFFSATLANAQPDTRRQQISAMVELVVAEDDTVFGRREDDAAAAEQLMRAQGLHGDAEAATARERLASMVAEQALRLVSLLHDLGHLPFSHDFEQTIAEWLALAPDAKTAYPHLAEVIATGGRLHEAIGYRLADWVQDELRGELRTRMPDELVDLARCSLRVAKRILHSEQASERLSKAPADRIARWLYGLVSGEIDADRCDYILRDSRNYGLIGAGYDLDRLITNLGVLPSKGDEPEWRTVVLAHGVSAAEEFLVARFRMYQWAIYHHKIQQSAAGLRRALRYSLTHANTDTQTFIGDIERLIAPTRATDAPEELKPYVDRFADYTDAWWIERLKSNLKDPVWAAADRDVRTWAALFLYRARGPRSLWKKPTDLVPEDLAALTIVARLAADQDERWDRAVTDIEASHHVLVVAFPWRPWKPAPSGEDPPVSALQVYEPSNEAARPLSQISPLVGALGTAWAHSLQVLALAARGEDIGGEDLLALRERVLDRLRQLAAGASSRS